MERVVLAGPEIVGPSFGHMRQAPIALPWRLTMAESEPIEAPILIRSFFEGNRSDGAPMQSGGLSR